MSFEAWGQETSSPPAIVLTASITLDAAIVFVFEFASILLSADHTGAWMWAGLALSCNLRNPP
jgi:hypothetical protein